MCIAKERYHTLPHKGSFHKMSKNELISQNFSWFFIGHDVGRWSSGKCMSPFTLINQVRIYICTLLWRDNVPLLGILQNKLFWQALVLPLFWSFYSNNSWWSLRLFPKIFCTLKMAFIMIKWFQLCWCLVTEVLNI